jgi:hypothetical protein
VLEKVALGGSQDASLSISLEISTFFAQEACSIESLQAEAPPSAPEPPAGSGARRSAES